MRPLPCAIRVGDLVVVGRNSIARFRRPCFSRKRMKRASWSSSRRRAGRDRQRLGLEVVVAQHERGHLVGHLRQHGVALLAR
jgi:hypothetical protein